MKNILLLLLSFFLLLSVASASTPSCVQFFQKDAFKNVEEIRPSFKTGKIPTDKYAFLKNVAQVIKNNESALQKILLRVNNVAGAKLEFELIKRQLGEELSLEMFSLQNTPPLENIAVYASTNVPLYTLISHGFIAKTLAKNVWFRTPEATREIYQDLFAEIQKHMPPGSLDGLNLITSSRDVQYDNFNKIYVMGMNKRGSRIERPPSEMVIFTGNPATARRILENNKSKVEEHAARLGFAPFKQTFLGFGAGINPIVVVSSAKQQIQKAVYLAMEPTRINNGQDCLAADFIAVDKRVAKPFVKSLLNEIAKLKPGNNDDPQAGYTPLTMNKSFDQLKAYREKFQSYLINPEAILDETSRLVSPHVFVFPYSMFKKVELREHFAPFYVIFKFENEEQFRKMMQDERVQEKTMYASVLGGPNASPDLDAAIQVLRETRHSVIVNDSLFGDLHANMPYGGRGASTSLVVNTSYDPKNGFQSAMGHRPKLLSHEAFTAFGNPRIDSKPRLLSQDYFERALSDILSQAALKSSSIDYSDPNWKTLKDPQLFDRPRGIQAIRKIIESEGLRIVVPQSRMSESDFEDFVQLHGVEPFLSTSKTAAAPVKVPGVLIHPANVGQGPELLNRARGRANPHLGWGNIHGIFSENKYAEYIFAEAVQPGIMAPTESFGTLSKSGVISGDFIRLRDDLVQDIRSVIQKRTKIDERLKSKMTKMLEALFQDLRRYYPEGAFIKNFGEFGTADLGTQITTFSTPTKMVVDEYLRRLGASVDALIKPAAQLNNRTLLKLMSSNSWEINSAFMTKLLLSPENILAQARVKIAKTPMGFPMEFRVDFIDGEAVLSRNRFGYEFLPNELKEAAHVLNNFFAKAPEKFRYMSGGADVAKLADGSWVIIEFNVGAESGTLSPRYFPFEYHSLISNLLGRPTPWLAKMEDIYSQGVEARIKHLKTLRYVRPLFWKGNGFADISVTEVGRYFRDLDLMKWTQNPTRQNAEQTLNDIKAMLEPWKEQENIRNLILSAEDFVGSYLHIKSVTPDI